MRSQPWYQRQQPRSVDACPQRFHMARHMMPQCQIQRLKVGPQPALTMQVREERGQFDRVGCNKSRIRIVEDYRRILLKQERSSWFRANYCVALTHQVGQYADVV